VVLAKEVSVVSTETLKKRAYIAQVLSELLRLMGQGEVPLEFEEREEGQLAVALHIASEDSALKASTGQKRAPLLNALQFLLNRLLKRKAETTQDSALGCGKVLLGVNGFPQKALPPPPEETETEMSSEEAPLPLQQDKEEQLSAIATALAQKCVVHGRVYAVLLLSRTQRACMRQAASKINGLRAFCEGEAHWSRLVVEPNKPVPMPQKNRIAFDKEGTSSKSPKSLANVPKLK
jgi:predicted RNA-binding protein Jag